MNINKCDITRLSDREVNKKEHETDLEYRILVHVYSFKQEINV
jgi:hypothetical protein